MMTFQQKQAEQAQEYFQQALLTSCRISLSAEAITEDFKCRLENALSTCFDTALKFVWLSGQQKLTGVTSIAEYQSPQIYLNCYQDDSGHILEMALAQTLSDSVSFKNIVSALNQAFSGEMHDTALSYQQYAEWQQESHEEGDSYWSEWQRIKRKNCQLPYIKPVYSSDTKLANVEVDLLDTGVPAADFEQIATGSWLQVLSRMVSEELNVGVVKSGRVADELLNSIGAYAVQIPMAIDVTVQLSRDTLLKKLDRLADDFLSAQVNYPKNTELKQIWPEHSFQYLDLEISDSQGLFSLQDVWHTAGIFQTQLCCIKSGGGFKLRLYYDQNYIKQTDATRFITTIKNAIKSSTAQTSVQTLSLYDEKVTGLLGCQQVDHHIPVANSIIDVLKQYAEAQPTMLAVADSQYALSYLELEQAVSKLECWLVENLPAGALVGICMQHSNNVLVSILGIIKAACTFVPIDPDLPFNRQSKILENCSLTIVDEYVDQRFKEADTNDQRYIQIQEIISSPLSEVPCRAIKPDDIAYVLYTSGSTGEPKGVEITHQNLMSYLESVVDIYLNDARKCIVHTSIGFDLTITSLFLSLLRGGSVEFVSADKTLETLQSCLQSQKDGVVLKLTPSHLKAMKPWIEGCTRDSLSIDTLIVGGEQLFSFELRAWFEKLPRLKVFNEYGPTEATVGCLVHQVKRSDHGAIPIGRPLKNTSIAVVDRLGMPVGEGVIGELYITGKGIARGYRNLPVQTEECFNAPNDTISSDYSWYKTGDLVCINQIDPLELSFVGRADRQVKVRGYRVELDEIEACLRSHSAVQNAHVILETNNGISRITAFCIQSENSELTEYVNAHLPKYAVPDRIVSVASFPLTQNGKVDNAALLKLADAQRAFDKIEASTEAEKEMANIWAEVLEISPPGINENFFELGGDSIRAVYVVANAKELSYNMSVHDLFKYPMIKDLLPNIQKESEQLVGLKSKNIDDLIASVDGLDESEIDALISELE